MRQLGQMQVFTTSYGVDEVTKPYSRRDLWIAVPLDSIVFDVKEKHSYIQRWYSPESKQFITNFTEKISSSEIDKCRGSEEILCFYVRRYSIKPVMFTRVRWSLQSVVSTFRRCFVRSILILPFNIPHNLIASHPPHTCPLPMQLISLILSP